MPLQRHLVYSGLLLPCPSINGLNLFPSMVPPHPSTRRKFSLMFFFHRALSTNSCHCFSSQAVYFTSAYYFLSRQPLLRCLSHGRQSWLHHVFKRNMGAVVFWITILQMPVTLRYLMYLKHTNIHSLNNCTCWGFGKNPLTKKF